MSKYLCDCGEVIRTSGEVPNPLEWLLISAIEYDQVEGEVDSDLLLQKMTSLFRCPNCDSLWIFWSGFAEEPEIYKVSRSDESFR